MNDKEKTEYLKHPFCCPKCQSGDINAGDYDFEDHMVWSEVSCEKCGAKWRDIYTLTDVESVE